MMKRHHGAFVGIDLGTTFSVVAFINDSGEAEAIKDENGGVLTPSVVYVGDSDPVVGFEAKELQAYGEENVASFFKRQMGERAVEWEFNGNSYDAIEFSAMVLRHLKTTAERQLQEAVTQAVITVPAYFNHPEREATIEAGRRAGLEVLSIINEPSAAALAYGVRPIDKAQTVLVYDLGGGTFDVSIVRITADEQHVLGTDGDHHLGGKDWDDRIMGYVADQFESEFGEDLLDANVDNLLTKAEEAKRSLSARESVLIKVHKNGRKGAYTLTREKFEELTRDLLQRTASLSGDLLGELGLGWSDLSDVLLVGGSTRMPMVRAWVELISGKQPKTTIDPDEAVALGAAIQAAMDVEAAEGKPAFSLAGRKKSIDAISHSLGMIAVNQEGSRYLNSILIRKNQPIPANFTRPYRLYVGDKGENQLDVYVTQGESEDPLECAYLGKYVFTGIAPESGHDAVLDVTYSYDRNGVVSVSAIERDTKRQLALSVEPLPGDVPDRFGKPPEDERIREHLTVYLAFDLSGSMSGAPLREAQKAARAFLSQCDLSTMSIGLISFSDRVLVESSACQNAKTIEKAIENLQCGRTGYGNATHPFGELKKLLLQEKGKRYGIVLADGVWSRQEDAVQIAKDCHEHGIDVIGVGFGGADKAFLQRISSSDQDSIFTDMNALVDTFSTIAQELTAGLGLGMRGHEKVIG